MADEILERDENRVTVLAGITDNAAQEIRAFRVDPTTGRLKTSSTGSSGDVSGPASSTDNAISRFDGTGGKTLQNSGVTIDDSDNIVVPGMVNGRDVATDGTKLDTIETNADVTDTANVTAAGAVMDSELTSETDVKALDQSVVSGASPTFSTTNFTDATNKRLLTDAQETLVDNAMQDLVDDTTPQLGGELDAGAHSIGFTMQTATGDGTTTIDWKLGNHFDFTFGAFNETFTFTAPTKPGVYTMSLKQDSVGSRTATWPGTVKWPGGTAPTLTTTATTGYDIISFRYDGTNYYGVSTLDFS